MAQASDWRTRIREEVERIEKDIDEIKRIVQKGGERKWLSVPFAHATATALPPYGFGSVCV